MQKNDMCKQGEIILVPFPFTDLSGSKIRPAVVVSNTKKADIIVAFITSQSKSKNYYSVAVKPTQGNGLKQASTIITDKLATIDTKIVLGNLGVLEEKNFKVVQSRLQRLFGL